MNILLVAGEGNDLNAPENKVRHNLNYNTMKKLIYGMVFFSIFGLLFSSCKKENKNFVNSQKQIETQNDNIIKNEVLQSEGELHNDLLDVMLSEVWDKNRDTAEYNFSNYCAQNNINANLIVPIDRSILYEPNEYIDFMENALSQCKNCDENIPALN